MKLRLREFQKGINMDSFEMYEKLIFEYNCDDADMMNELMNWLSEEKLCEFFRDYAKDRDIELEAE